MEDYLILGACNPALAQRALDVDRRIGLLLPCNIVIRSGMGENNTVVVEAMNPNLLVQVAGEQALGAVADDATARLRAAIESLRHRTGT